MAELGDPEAALREELLCRLATDLRVVAADEHEQRPAQMACCWVSYERPWPPVPGRTTTWVHSMCRTAPGSRPCPHVHHKDDVFMAQAKEEDE